MISTQQAFRHRAQDRAQADKEQAELENVEKIKHLLSEVPYQEIRNIFLQSRSPKGRQDIVWGCRPRKSFGLFMRQKSFSPTGWPARLDKMQKVRARASHLNNGLADLTKSMY